METASKPIALPSAAPNPALAEDAKPVRKRRPFLILSVIAVGAVGAVLLYAKLTGGRETTDDAQIAADIVPVSPRVGGLVARVHIGENQRVKQGEPLIELDAADLKARAQQAEAELATAQAQAQVA